MKKSLAQIASILASAILAALASVSVRPAAAHHGWGQFDTRHAYYLSGTITAVRWGNPHSEVHLKIEKTTLPADWNERKLPPGANEKEGRLTMASARPYDGPHKELHLVLAGPDWMKRWGLDRPLKVGEKIEAVGFLNTAENDELRPVVFWLANGQGVWQQLTAFPQEPEPAQPSNASK